MGLISPIKLNIADKLEKDKEFRKHFFRVQAQDRIAMNIKKLRKERNKTQIDFAKEANMKQSAVSRIEQADYSGWSMNTLFRVADVLDARLRVSFEPVEDVIDWYRKKEEEAIDDDQFMKIYTPDIPKDYNKTVDYPLMQLPPRRMDINPQLYGQARP